MALNKYMHPRNRYKNQKPDFKVLASKYDYFRERTTVNAGGNVILDFKEPASLRALTQALLEEDFGLTVSLPLDRLVPTVPQRLNYILWLEDILEQKRDMKGIDIGTGASCIYPLLGCRQNAWTFLATELDEQNIYFAQKNVQQNKMCEKIKIKPVSEDVLLLQLLQDNTDSYDFSMCNPPFYADHLEAQGITSTRSDDRPDSDTLSTASETEAIAWGGEVRFVTQMIEESLKLTTRIRVYTSLLGKKTSVNTLKDVLSKHKVPKYSTTEFCQGRTMRWGLAWSFDESVTFPKSLFKEQKKEGKPPILYAIPRTEGLVEDYTVPTYTAFIRKHIEQLQINYHTVHSGKFYTCIILQAKTNTWSHQRRKRRQRSKQQSGSNDAPSKPETENMGLVSELGAACDAVKQENDTADAKTTEDSSMDTNELEIGGKLDAKDHQTLDTSDAESGGKVDLKGETLKRGLEDNGESEKCAKKVKLGTESDGTSKEINTVTITHSENNLAASKCKTTPSNKNISSNKELKSEENMNTSSNNATIPCENESASSKHSEAMETSPNTDSKTAATPPDASIAKKGTKNSEAVTIATCSDITKADSTNANTSDLMETSPNKAADTSSISTVVMPSRKAIIEQFWQEQKANQPGARKKTFSVYEKLEAFSETEECEVLCKLVLRKDEGNMSLSLLHQAGNRQAVHQIMQYFKNILSTKSSP